MIQQPKPQLHTILHIPHRPDTTRTRGGYYSRELNVWVAEDLEAFLQTQTEEQHILLDAFARMALDAGRVHQAQIADAQNGGIWPSKWIEQADGNRLISFCQAHPEASHPYTCVRENGEILPFSQAYHAHLHPFCQGIEHALQMEEQSIRLQTGYLKALLDAFTPEEGRKSDLEKMGMVDTEWVRIPTDTPLLLLSEFTESYSDPLKKHVADQAEVQAWAGQVSELTGMPPWKFFFEFRVFAAGKDALTSAEIDALRKTNQRLYSPMGLGVPSEKAMTEFRKVVMVAGHGANPPKNAKNYPNQTWIRNAHGYRNIIYANQVEASIQAEILPSLRAAFDAEWVNSKSLTEQALRLRALCIVSHEECHPWLVFDEVSWMEEFKSDILGLWSLANSPAIQVDLGEVLKVDLGAMLLLHRYHLYLLEHGDGQFNDYHVGSTIFLNHLLREGVLVTDQGGMIVNVNGLSAQAALEHLAQRVITIRQGGETIQSLYEDLHDPAVYERFRGWKEHQAYFENLWRGK